MRLYEVYKLTLFEESTKRNNVRYFMRITYNKIYL